MTITTPPESRRRRPKGDEDVAAAPAGRATRQGATPAPRTRRARSARDGERGTGAPAPAGRPARETSGRTSTTERPATTRRPQRGATVRPAPARRPARSTSPARGPARRAGRLAPPRARAPFVLLVVGLLAGALVSLLLLNTVLAQDAFTLSELQRSNRQLSDRKQALQDDIAREEDPAVLHRKARSLGMVDSRRPAFIDARTGRVTEGGARPPGVPDEAVAAAAAGGVTGAPGAIVPPVDTDRPAGAKAGTSTGATAGTGTGTGSGAAAGTSTGTEGGAARGGTNGAGTGAKASGRR